MQKLVFPNPGVTLAFVCLSIFLSGLSFSQNDSGVENQDGLSPSTDPADSLKNTGSTVLLPVLGYTPDTGLMLGGTLLRFFYLEPEYANARPSVFSPIFIYTLKNQILVFLGMSLNWDEDRNSLNMVPQYAKFPDQYYGIGRDAEISQEEAFTSEQIGLDLDYNRRVWRQWRLGLRGQITKHRLVETEIGGQLDQGHIPGTDSSLLMNLGPALLLDSRDNTWSPNQGCLLWSSVRYSGAGLGSDFTYQEYILDLRGYRSIGKNTVLAGQLESTHLVGEAPFFALPKLGGDDGLRGYRGGLYRDKTRALGRLEIRRNHIWGPLGAVAFAGIGDVAPSLDKLTLSKGLWSAGFGLRYMLDSKERVNLRVDFGYGEGDSGFYLSLGEAF